MKILEPCEARERERERKAKYYIILEEINFRLKKCNSYFLIKLFSLVSDCLVREKQSVLKFSIII